VNRPKGNN